MNLDSIFKPIIYGLLFLIGLGTIITPLVSYKNAYFVGEDYYISMCDSVEAQYTPHIESLVQISSLSKAQSEKDALYEAAKPIADSLAILQSKTELGRDKIKAKEVQILINKFQNDLLEKVEEIEGKFDIGLLPKAELDRLVNKTKDTLTLNKYVLIVANQIRNPNDLNTISKVKENDINIQKVNLQDKNGFIIFGLCIIGILIFFIALELQLIPLHNTIVKYSMFSAFSIITTALGIASYYSLADDIQFKDVFEKREIEIREKLLTIRDIQVEYLASKGEYCSEWDSLMKFIQSDSIAVIKYLVDKNDTIAVNDAIRNNRPIKDTTYVSIEEKVFGEKHTVQIDSLPLVPYSLQKFELVTKKTKNNNGRYVFFLEVQTLKKTFVEGLRIYPENFDEEALIKIGSLTNPTTEGNWQ